jgi:hypothetical protein
MPYLRQRQKIPATGRVPLKLSPAQRDQLLGTTNLPRKLGHLLHHAPVKQGKLRIRLTNAELDALILSAATIPTSDPTAKRALDTFLSYLEAQSDRFDSEEPEELRRKHF